MNFENTYTKEQQEFRKEVRAWIKANVPENMRMPMGTGLGIIGYEQAGDRAPEMMAFWKEKHLELGKRGWLYPTYPKQYGGGGLTAEHEAILAEEFHKWGVVPHHSDAQTIDPVLVWGTEEQKQKFVVPLLRGEKTSHRTLTEPQSGSDLANVRTRAVRDGDEWLITGQKVFISTFEGVDYLSGLAVTDPDAPRHRNLGFFLIPNPAKGLTMQTMNLITGKPKSIFMEYVRAPADHLIGDPTQGWQVMGTVLDQEQQSSGSAVAPENRVVTTLVDFMQQTRKRGTHPEGDPVLQQHTVSAWIDDHIYALFVMRTHSLFMNKMAMGWEGATGRHINREEGLRTKARVRTVMGMYAHLGKHDPLAPYGGLQDWQQMSYPHTAGGINIGKVIIARRIGISRTRERAAPTRMTAPSGVGAVSGT